jgi:HEAT repeats
MQGPVHKLAALVIGLCLTLLSGCAETANNISGGFARMIGNTPDQQMHIKTPADRRKELLEIRKTATQKSPEEQQQISATLAKEIQRENDPLMRRHLLRALAAFPTPMAGAVLNAALGDTDMECRRTACECLGTRGDKAAVEELTKVVTSDTVPEVRLAAVRGLGHTKDTAALLPLSEAMGDPDPAIQSRAQESLRSVSGRDFGDDAQAWREYAKTGQSSTAEVGIATRLRRMFY